MQDTSLLVAAVAAIGALVAGATALSLPRVSFGIIFVLASLSRATLETPIGTMRMEMPAIAVVAAVLLGGGRFKALLRVPRSTVAIGVAFGLYLGVLALSSAIVAPGTAQSLRMVGWLAISMLGGVVAFVLIRPKPVAAIQPLALGGALLGAIGLMDAVLFFIAGPGFNLGIQDPFSTVPRVFALGWETNLYASFLAMCAFFALEAARGPRRRTGLAMLALVLIGFALGVTRGAYIGLFVGAVVYFIVRRAARRRDGEQPQLGAIAVALIVVGIVSANVLLPNALERQAASGNHGQGPNGSPTSSQPLIPSIIVPWAELDTVSFRLERVPIAFADLRESPFIGFGAEAFGQRHPERHAGPGPDHIAILAVVVPYEAGIIGAAALLGGFALLITNLLRLARRARAEADWPVVGAAAAFIGSLVSILVAYEVTNALHLAVNWIVIGAAVALTVPHLRPPISSDP